MLNKNRWQRILQFELDNPDSDFNFTDRLVRENGWSVQYALRTILEYKRFIYLICVADHPLTPSDQVDQVWHLHLLYTQSYWEDFCKETLGRQIHHGPTKGGESEKAKFHNWYEETKKLYLKEFEEEPPPDIWPSSTRRFGEINFQRVSLHRKWIIPKPRFFRKWKF